MSTKMKKIFKWISFAILAIVIATPLLADMAQNISEETKITDKIYTINCVLCVISIIVAILYVFCKVALKEDNAYSKRKSVKKKIKKEDLKKYLKKYWPCALLILFMLWTAVGCIQAGTEADAETTLKYVATGKIERSEAEIERLQEIANWSSGDRMPNAGDRAWNGCENLKDGYFSFLFYMTVAINVVLLGSESNDLKKYLLRMLLVASAILVFLSFLNFWNPAFGAALYNRGIFNNSNHFGYYLSISTLLSAMIFLKDDNIYFRGIAIVSYIMMVFVLIINNTFGAYLGVMIALICIFAYTCLNLWFNRPKEKLQKVETRQFLTKTIIISIVFVAFSLMLTGAKAELYGIKYNYTINGEELVGISKVRETNLTFNFLSNGYEINLKKEVGYKEEVDNKVNVVKPKTSIVERNFVQLGKDIGIFSGQFGDENDDVGTQLETSGNAVSGNVKNIKKDEENKSGLTEEVSKIGSGRGEVWIKSLDLIKQRPLFGWGLENLLNEFHSQYGINEGRTHNLILQLAGTTGVVGMLLYIVGIAAIFFKVVAKFKYWGFVEFVTIPVFISYMVSSMFGNSAFYTSPYFMIILGMMIASMIYLEVKENEEEKK